MLLAFPILANAQKVDTLKEVQCVGIVSGKNLPISQTRINCSEYSYLNKQGDPFFVVAAATPSIYAQSDNGGENGYSYMRLRGLDQTRINYNLNGIPLNESEDQGLYFSNMPGFYNYISSINVERGVGSSKYGNTSIAGSVDMETRSASEKTFEINSLLKNSYNDQNSNFFYSSGLIKVDSSKVSFQLGGTLIRNNGFKEHSGNDGGSIYYAVNRFDKNNIFKFYGFSGVSHNQLAFYGQPMDTIYKYGYKYNGNSIADKDTFNQNMCAFNWVNYANLNRKFNTTLYFDNVNGTYSTGGILFGVNSYQYGAMSNMILEHEKSIVNIGANANIYSRTHFGSDNGGYYDIDTNCNKYTNTGYKEDVILYIKGEHKGVVNLFYDVQARDVWFNAASKTYNWFFVNPKIGMRTNIGDNHIYANMGMTQREPTRTDMIQNIAQSNSYFGANPDNTTFLDSSSQKLKPEIVYDFEVGDNVNVGAFEINANAYLMVINNEYVATGVIDQYSGFMTKKMVTSTLRNGVETNIKAHIKNFTLFFNGNIQNSAMGSVNSIPFAPNYIGSLGVSYKKKFYNIGVVEQVISSMTMNLSDANTKVYESQPYAITNIFADVKLTKAMTISVKANNLLNSKYYIPAGVGYTDQNYNYHNIPTYYVGQLSNYSISLKWKI